MADLTPTTILAPPDEDAIEAKILDYLRAIPGFPITDYESGGVTRSIIEMEKMADLDLLGSAVPSMVGQGFRDFASGDWMTLVAQQLYSFDRVGAVQAIQTMILTCGVSNGPYTITAGQLWFVGPTGNRWSNKTGGTLASGGTLSIQIAAEGPGSKYNDPAGTIHTMIPALAGVSASNTAGDFSAVVPGALGSGTITPSRTSGGVVPGQASFIIRIDGSGQAGAGAWSYSVDGGRTFTSVGVIATTDLLLAGGGASGTRVTFANGGGTPSFVFGDQYSFSTPGTSFVTVGKDQETDLALSARCDARWPNLALVKTQSRYLKWAKAASAEVTRARLEEDAVYKGRLYLTLAGIAGAVSGGAVTAVQTYVDQRAPIGRIIVAQNSVPTSVTATGTVTVTAAKKTAVQAAAQTAWQAKLFGTDIGGVVRVADLVRCLMDAGALDVTTPRLNGGGNVSLSSTWVAILPSGAPLLANQMTWKTV